MTARHLLESPRVALAIIFAALLAIPLVAPNDYVIALANNALVNLILIASLNLLMGCCGQISLSHAGFFGLGAYVSGIASAKAGLSAWLGLPAAVLVCAAGAAAIGLPALRLRGHYLAMATLGWNAILIVLFNQLVSLTGGPNGLLGVKPFALGGLVLDDDAKMFPLIWLCAGLVTLAILNLLQSRLGRAMRAVATNELGADALGIDSFRIKLTVFVITAAMAGLAGSLYVHQNQFASPETFGLSASILLIVMVALGGAGRFWGPFIGTLVATLVPPLLQGYENAELLIFGASMLVVLIFLPGGLVSLPTLMRRRPA